MSASTSPLALSDRTTDRVVVLDQWRNGPATRVRPSLETRRIVIATRDAALARRLSSRIVEDGNEGILVTEPSELATWRSGREAILVDGHDADLTEAAGLGRECHPDRLLAFSSSDPDRAFSVPRNDVDAAMRTAATLAPTRPRDRADAILGVSSRAARMREQTRAVAGYVDVNVLILGETGTGKELVARSIHEIAFGQTRPFIAVNCGALSAHLVESELFGHVAGAFTGAKSARVGLMEAAGNGTLFLDEIGEMPLEAQSALLRALEYRTFRRVGSNQDIPFRARVVAATNRLDRKDRGRLRKDLYFRLAGVTVRTPALAERMTDVPLLTRHFLRNFAERYGRAIPRIDDLALRHLEKQPWPGNVRELEAVVVHAGILAQGGDVEDAHVRTALESRLDMRASTRPPPAVFDPAAPASAAPLPAPARVPAVRPLPELERESISNALAQCGGNVSQSARLLGIARSTLRDRMRKYDLR